MEQEDQKNGLNAPIVDTQKTFLIIMMRNTRRGVIVKTKPFLPGEHDCSDNPHCTCGISEEELEERRRHEK